MIKTIRFIIAEFIISFAVDIYPDGKEKVSLCRALVIHLENVMGIGGENENS